MVVFLLKGQTLQIVGIPTPVVSPNSAFDLNSRGGIFRSFTPQKKTTFDLRFSGKTMEIQHWSNGQPPKCARKMMHSNDPKL